MPSCQLDPQLLSIYDGTRLYHGGRQEWYAQTIQKRTGCAPTTASTMAMFQQRLSGTPAFTRAQYVGLLETMWDYVTPGPRGIDNLEEFIAGYKQYLAAQQLPLFAHSLNCSPDITQRPDKQQVYTFIHQALSHSIPLAFLNLDHGQETRLESWHWVTLIGIDFDSDRDNLLATIVDGGQLISLDLGLWLSTSVKGGGFVYFSSDK